MRHESCSIRTKWSSRRHTPLYFIIDSFKTLQMKQIKMRNDCNDDDIDIYRLDDDFSLDRALRDSFDSLPVSNENKKYSFLVNKWGVDLDIHKSNKMLQIILDHLLDSDEKLTRLSNSLDIRHIDDPLFDPDLQSDNENQIDDDLFQNWLANLFIPNKIGPEKIPKRKKAQNLQKNTPASKKTKTTASKPHELTPTRKSTSSSPTDGEAIPSNTTVTTETTGAVGDETTAVNNDSVDSTTEFYRVMRENYNHFVNNLT